MRRYSAVLFFATASLQICAGLKSTEDMEIWENSGERRENKDNEKLTENEMVELCTMRDCSAYDCFHRAGRCNTTHIMATTGKASCERMWSKDNLRLFNRDGQKWMRCWNKCQIDFIAKYFKKYHPVNCDYLHSAVTQSSIDCHVSCGFCSICKDARIAMLKMLKHRSLSLLKRNPEFRGAIKQCGGPSACALPLT